MDSGNCSKAKMLGQAIDATLANLDKCVEIVQMSSSKLINNPSQPNQTSHSKSVQSQDEIAKEGFPKFKKLPAEIRLKIWGRAMPRCGIYTALMFGREEPMPQQPAAPAPMVFRVVYRLEPMPRHHQDEELRARLDTMRAIQHTCSEAASEVQRAFPTTINCTGGKLRFNAELDTLALSDSKCYLKWGIFRRFYRYNQGAIIFADDWHKIPRKMLFCSSNIWVSIQTLDFLMTTYPGTRLSDIQDGEDMEGFMDFLGDCTSLTTFGFMYNREDDASLITPEVELRTLYHKYLRFCQPGPILQGHFYPVDAHYTWYKGLQYFVRGFHGMHAMIHGQRLDGQEVPGVSQDVNLGRPELEHLNLQAVIPAGHNLHRVLRLFEEE